ncbi:MAG TPA: hypothetical protein VHB48_14520, partial [Chitinophagaceae bacterium]|nr:hypothetical protein [Chitinophagaceae bacterium]
NNVYLVIIHNFNEINAMAKKDSNDLLNFLKPFPEETQQLVLWLRNFAWDACPGANELIYDNYNALAIGWSLTDRVTHTICSIAAYRAGTNVHFGFYWGSQVSDTKKMLLGSGSQYRYILVRDKESFPVVYITGLIHEAHVNALAKIKDEKQVKHGLTIIKSVSGNKREPAKTKALPKTKTAKKV